MLSAHGRSLPLVLWFGCVLVSASGFPFMVGLGCEFAFMFAFGCGYSTCGRGCERGDSALLLLSTWTCWGACEATGNRMETYLVSVHLAHCY